MALRKTLAHRLLTTTVNSPLLRRFVPRRVDDELGLARRFFRSPAPAPATQLIDRIRGAFPVRIRLDGIAPSSPAPATSPAPAPEMGAVGFTAEEVRKLAAAAEMEAVRARVRAAGTARACVGYGEFARICEEAVGTERGRKAAKALDVAGDVVVLGDVVFLRPELVARAIESIIPHPHSGQKAKQHKELKELEEKKSVIDSRAEALVKKELWMGLGFLVVQTLGFMRLTFWELSWDVMEPICFYVTSFYFMAGYTFFLKTSRDPSFEGFFASRFATKQKRLMRAQNFDVGRYNELRGSVNGGTCCDYCHKSTFIGGV